MPVLYNKYLHISTVVILVLLFNFLLFFKVLSTFSNSICLFEDYTINLEGNVWNTIKILYFPSILVSWSFISYSFFTKNPNLFKNKYVKSHQNVINDKELCLKIGKNMDSNEDVIIREKGLYQNILITRNYRHRKNILGDVSLFRTTNKAKSWHANIRCKRELSQESSRIKPNLQKKCHRY